MGNICYWGGGGWLAVGGGGGGGWWGWWGWWVVVVVVVVVVNESFSFLLGRGLAASLSQSLSPSQWLANGAENSHLVARIIGRY